MDSKSEAKAFRVCLRSPEFKNSCLERTVPEKYQSLIYGRLLLSDFMIVLTNGTQPPVYLSVSDVNRESDEHWNITAKNMESLPKSFGLDKPVKTTKDLLITCQVLMRSFSIENLPLALEYIRYQIKLANMPSGSYPTVCVIDTQAETTRFFWVPTLYYEMNSLFLTMLYCRSLHEYPLCELSVRQTAVFVNMWDNTQSYRATHNDRGVVFSEIALPHDETASTVVCIGDDSDREFRVTPSTFSGKPITTPVTEIDIQKVLMYVPATNHAKVN